MTWFRNISMNAVMEADFTDDSSSYHNDTFSVPFSDHIPLSETELSTIPPVFNIANYESSIEYVMMEPDNLIRSGNEKSQLPIENKNLFDVQSDFINCTSININMNSAVQNSDSEFEIK